MKIMNRMKKTTIIWGMVIIGLFILLTLFGFLYKNKANVYKELENKLVEAEKKYADAHFAYPEKGKVLKTDATTLIKENFLDDLNLENEECTGYAIVTHNSTVYEYKGYVKCNNYTTKGYEK